MGKTRRKAAMKWQGYQMDDDDSDLAQKYNIHLQDKTRDLINEQYWTSLGHVIRKGGKKQMLPASYQLDYCNWLQVIFDYVSMEVVSGKKQKGSYFLIPDTVLIRKRRAVAVVSADGGSTVFRVDRSSDLEPATLLESFCSSYRKLGLLTPSTIIAQLTAAVFDEQTGEWSSTVEYFTQTALKTYLYDHLRVEDRQAILQLFVPPSGPHNALIRAWWSPYSMKLEQRVNMNDVNDAHRPAHERCATFDGPIHLSEMRGLPGQDLRDEVAMSMQEMVRRVAELLPVSQRLWRAQFYFKLGLDQRVWFLWCGSMQFVHASESAVDSNIAHRNRPMTPVCVPSRHESEDSELSPLRHDRDEDSKRVWKAGSCPACGRVEDKTLDMFIPYMSLLRRLNPGLHKQILHEQQVVRTACKSEEAWTAHLQGLGATRFLRYGEKLEVKFPRPTAQTPPAQSGAAVASKSAHQQPPNAAAPQKTESEELQKESDRRYLRMVVKSVRGGAAVSEAQSREIALYAATNPQGFYKRTIAVCEDCAIDVGVSDMRKAQTDLLDCTAPLDPPSKRKRRPRVQLGRVKEHGREGATTVLGIAPTDEAPSRLPSLPRSSRHPSPTLSSKQREPIADFVSRSKVDAEVELPQVFPLVKSQRRRSGVSTSLNVASPLTAITTPLGGAEVGARRLRSAFQAKSSQQSFKKRGCDAFIARKKKFDIDQYKFDIGTTMADALNMSDELQGLEQSLLAEEEALEDDHSALDALLHQKYQELALSPQRVRHRILHASRRNAELLLSPRSRQMIDTWKQQEALPFMAPSVPPSQGLHSPPAAHGRPQHFGQEEEKVNEGRAATTLPPFSPDSSTGDGRRRSVQIEGFDSDMDVPAHTRTASDGESVKSVNSGKVSWHAGCVEGENANSPADHDAKTAQKRSESAEEDLDGNRGPDSGLLARQAPGVHIEYPHDDECSRMAYLGQVNPNRVCQGKGVLWWQDGTTYMGTWKEDKPWGCGIQVYSDGSFFKGHFVNDARSGVGVFCRADGTAYCGMWSEGDLIGMGFTLNLATQDEKTFSPISAYRGKVARIANLDVEQLEEINRDVTDALAVAEASAEEARILALSAATDQDLEIDGALTTSVRVHTVPPLDAFRPQSHDSSVKSFAIPPHRRASLEDGGGSLGLQEPAGDVQKQSKDSHGGAEEDRNGQPEGSARGESENEGYHEDFLDDDDDDEDEEEEEELEVTEPLPGKAAEPLPRAADVEQWPAGSQDRTPAAATSLHATMDEERPEQRGLATAGESTQASFTEIESAGKGVEGERTEAGTMRQEVEWQQVAGTSTHVERVRASRPMAQVSRLRTETEEARVRKSKHAQHAAPQVVQRERSDPQSRDSEREREVAHLLGVYGVQSTTQGSGLKQKMLPAQRQSDYAHSYSPFRRPVQPQGSSKRMAATTANKGASKPSGKYSSSRNRASKQAPIRGAIKAAQASRVRVFQEDQLAFSSDSMRASEGQREAAMIRVESADERKAENQDHAPGAEVEALQSGADHAAVRPAAMKPSFSFKAKGGQKVGQDGKSPANDVLRRDSNSAPIAPEAEHEGYSDEFEDEEE